MESIKELRTICQSVHKEDFSAQLVRKVSIYFTWLFLMTPISGNGVSAVNVLVGVVAGVTFAGGNPWFYLAGLGLFLLNAIFDGCDGEVARYRKQSSLTGLYADRINSIFVFPFMLFGTAIGLFRQYDQPWILVVGFLAAWGFSSMRMAKMCIDTTIIDGLTLTKARREEHLPDTEEQGKFVPFSEYLRSKKKWYLMVLDFVLVRQPGFALVYILGVTAELILLGGKVANPFYFSPLFVVIAGYAGLTMMAVPAVLYLVIRQRKVESLFERICRQMNTSETNETSGEKP